MFWKIDVDNDADEKFIIYGAGVDGILTFITLLNAGIYVSAFCDADREKQNVRIMNKKVISPDELYVYENKEQILVFVGSRKYKEEIKENLRNAGFTKICENRGKYQEKILCGKIYQYDRRSWYSVIEQAYHKRIYIYGASNLELEFAEKLKLTDIKIEALLVDDETQIQENRLGIPKIHILELEKQDKNHIMIYVMSNISERVKVLEKLGLKYGYHYRMGPYINGGYRIQNPYVRLDVNCGFMYVDHEETPGYTVMGDENRKYKIMILGDSTVDPLYNYYPTWVKFFRDNLEKSGIKVMIYNGAQQAYSEQQHLFKLIRDLPIIEPDIVIHYGGELKVMNLMQGERLFYKNYPFASTYSVNLLKGLMPMQRGHVNKKLVKEVFGTDEKQELCLGLSDRKTGDDFVLAAENYLYAVDCMNAVCKMRGVRFLNFLNPVLIYTEKIRKADWEKLYHDEGFSRVKEFRESALLFRKTVLEKADTNMHTDLTQVLDRDNMYHDVWHPNEQANEILAGYVSDRVMRMLRED